MNMARRRDGVGASYMVVLAIAIVLSSLVTYSLFARTPSNPPNAGGNDALIAKLQAQNLQLYRELQNRTSMNTTLEGLDPVSIYRNDSAGVVTVQGVDNSQGAPASVLGTGFVYNFSGTEYIVTNYHVVQGISELTVTFQTGDSFPATVVGSDGYSDLAVLNLTAPPSEFHPLRIVSSSTLVVGQPVVAIGNPYGLSGSMTFGIVSQLGRTISESAAGNYSIANVIQFSAPINPGNSGGPLLDATGAVVGITTATVVSSQGVGFAIPSDTILKEIHSLIVLGWYAMHPLMGIQGADMSYQLAQLQKTNVTYGVLVVSVTQGGPASKAGLVAGTKTAVVQGTTYNIGGDIIVSLNGTKIVNTDALSSYLAQFAFAGQELNVGIIRNGQPMTLMMTLGTRPLAQPV